MNEKMFFDNLLWYTKKIVKSQEPNWDFSEEDELLEKEEFAELRKNIDSLLSMFVK